MLFCSQVKLTIDLKKEGESMDSPLLLECLFQESALIVCYS